MKVLQRITPLTLASLKTRITRSTTLPGQEKSDAKLPTQERTVGAVADNTVYCQVPRCGASVPKLYEQHTGTCVEPKHKSCMIRRGDAS